MARDKREDITEDKQGKKLRIFFLGAVLVATPSVSKSFITSINTRIPYLEPTTLVY